MSSKNNINNNTSTSSTPIKRPRRVVRFEEEEETSSVCPSSRRITPIKVMIHQDEQQPSTSQQQPSISIQPTRVALMNERMKRSHQDDNHHMSSPYEILRNMTPIEKAEMLVATIESILDKYLIDY